MVLEKEQILAIFYFNLNWMTIKSYSSIVPWKQNYLKRVTVEITQIIIGSWGLFSR